MRLIQTRRRIGLALLSGMLVLPVAAPAEAAPPDRSGHILAKGERQGGQGRRQAHRRAERRSGKARQMGRAHRQHRRQAQDAQRGHRSQRGQHRQARNADRPHRSRIREVHREHRRQIRQGPSQIERAHRQHRRQVRDRHSDLRREILKGPRNVHRAHRERREGLRDLHREHRRQLRQGPGGLLRAHRERRESLLDLHREHRRHLPQGPGGLLRAHLDRRESLLDLHREHRRQVHRFLFGSQPPPLHVSVIDRQIPLHAWARAPRYELAPPYPYAAAAFHDYGYDDAPRHWGSVHRARSYGHLPVFAVDGYLEDGGYPCARLFDDQGNPYILEGRIEGLYAGDHVRLAVHEAPFSSCGGDGRAVIVTRVVRVWADDHHRSAYFQASLDGPFDVYTHWRRGDDWLRTPQLCSSSDDGYLADPYYDPYYDPYAGFDLGYGVGGGLDAYASFTITGTF